MSVPVHVFFVDAALSTDFYERPFCATCGLPKSNGCHNVPPMSDELRKEEARRQGEVAGR